MYREFFSLVLGGSCCVSSSLLIAFVDSGEGGNVGYASIVEVIFEYAESVSLCV